MFAVKLAKQDAPPQLLMVLAAAGSFAAISVIFGSPIVAAVLVIEASGLGGATLPLILIPGLIAAGIGSLVFIGMANWTALSTSAYSLEPLEAPALRAFTWEKIGWTIALGLVGALVTFVVRRLGLGGVEVVPQPLALGAGAGSSSRCSRSCSVDDDPRREEVRSPARTRSRASSTIPARGHGCAAHGHAVQGPGVEHMSRHLPWWTDVPGDLPRRRGRHRRVPSPGISSLRRSRSASA